MTVQLGRFQLPSSRPWVMGILNLTPDSFFDGGLVCSVDQARTQAAKLKAQGAHILDLGGESTRPGARPVAPEEEARRVLPVLEALQDLSLPLSLDSRRSEVVAAALDIGIDMVNDVTGFRDPGMQSLLPNIQKAGCAVCIMHMQGEPQTMQRAPSYNDVVDEVFGFLRSRHQDLIDQGFSPHQIFLDPGFGFGKSLAHNQALMRALPDLAHHHRVLVGLSRKSMIGEMLGRPSTPADRLAGSLAASLFAAQKGAHVLRVHDVQQTVDALAVWHGLS